MPHAKATLKTKVKRYYAIDRYKRKKEMSSGTAGDATLCGGVETEAEQETKYSSRQSSNSWTLFRCTYREQVNPGRGPGRGTDL